MLQIPLWRSGREQQSLDARLLHDYRGVPLAQVQTAPALLIHRTVAELRRAAPGPGEDPRPLWEAIARAGRLLASAELGGQSPAVHNELVSRATGAPIQWSSQALAELAKGLEGIEGALQWQVPGGDLSLLQSRRLQIPGDRSCAWVPVGQVLGFVAPSNHPAVHLTWVLALAMGWTVLVRPGADDPLTPWRLLLALKEAGFPTERIALLPGGHELVPALITHCDRTVAYGGSALEGLIGQDRRVLFNGPGRSKVLVDGPVPQEPTLHFLLDSILHDGGRKCTCASAILVRGEAPGLIPALADRLRDLPLLDPLDPAALVPAWKEAAAIMSTPAQLVEVDGVAFARPALVECPDPRSPLFGAELPAPWATATSLPTEADPFPLLQGSLAVSLLSEDRPLVERCLLEPSIRKLFVGPVPPWHTEPGAPHQGRLADFLFTAKAHREVKPAWS